MELVEVEITGQVITSQHGTLASGAVIRVSAEFAKHLVDDCNAAKYRLPKTEVAAPTKPARVPKPKKAADLPPTADGAGSKAGEGNENPSTGSAGAAAADPAAHAGSADEPQTKADAAAPDGGQAESAAADTNSHE